MEKRFELDGEWVEDTETCSCYKGIALVKLLNVQDKKIMELESENQRLLTRLDKTISVRNNLFVKIEQLQLSEKQKAIEVLEKVREFYNNDSDSDWIIDLCKLDEYINYQIAKLRAKD